MVKLTTSEAVQQLKRYLSEYYTPRNREAHRMAIEALTERRVYVILVQNYDAGDAVPKVSQTGYKTLEDAQAFCRSRSAKSVTMCQGGWVFWADDIRYEIVEVSV